MPKVYRPTYSKPIPEDAKRFTKAVKKPGRTEQVPTVKFKSRDGDWVEAAVVQSGKGAGTHCLVPSTCYYGKVQGQPVKLTTDKTASEVQLADLVREAARCDAGMSLKAASNRGRLMADHLGDFAKELAAGLVGKRGKPGAKHVKTTVQRIKAAFDACGFVKASDISLVAVQQFLAALTDADAPAALPSPADPRGYTKKELSALLGVSVKSVGVIVSRRGLAAAGNGKARRFPRETALALFERRRPGKGLGEGTAGAYARDLRCFGRWLARRGRVAADPLTELSGSPTRDHRHTRRALSVAELRGLIDAARGSRKAYRGMSPADRAALYLVAMTTGLRAGELAMLTPERFRVDDDTPVVVLLEGETKNDQAAFQPLPADAVEALRPWLAGKPKGRPLWPGSWIGKPVELLRKDLKRAGIAYAIEGPDGRPLFADFHSLRHSYIRHLKAAGTPVDVAMQLARHSDPRLTFAVYGRENLAGLGGAANRLPEMATSPISCTPLVQESEAEGWRAMGGDSEAAKATPPSRRRKPLPVQGIGGE